MTSAAWPWEISGPEKALFLLGENLGFIGVGVFWFRVSGIGF